MDNAVALRPEQPMELSVDQLTSQVSKIQEVMKKVMQKDQHYGTIPGTDKPTLLKPGAEKLGLVFRLAPSFEIRKTELPNNHREFEIVCTLTHIPTGQIMGQGVGSCSTMESKYRWRRGEATATDIPVPQQYWNMRKSNAAKAQELLGGKGFVTVKVDSVWFIGKKSDERIENIDIADTYNTVLKMAKKRAQVDATLTATAASDIFTQDIEDWHDEPETKQDAQGSTNGNESKQTTAPTENGSVLSCRKVLWDSLQGYAKDKKYDPGKLLKELTGHAFMSNVTEDEAKAAQIKFEKEYLQADDVP